MSPTKVDFYVLEANGQKALLFACQLIAKAFLDDQRIYVQVDSQAEVSHLDRLLWTFSDTSFLPHSLAEENLAPIQIGTEATLGGFDILMNLGRQFPDNFAAFKRIIEFVFPDPLMQQLSRARYRDYRSANCELTTYKIKDNHNDNPKSY